MLRVVGDVKERIKNITSTELMFQIIDIISHSHSLELRQQNMRFLLVLQLNIFWQRQLLTTPCVPRAHTTAVGSHNFTFHLAMSEIFLTLFHTTHTHNTGQKCKLPDPIGTVKKTHEPVYETMCVCVRDEVETANREDTRVRPLTTDNRRSGW